MNDTVFAVLGGFPARYDALWNNVKAKLQNGQDARETIGRHLCAEIFAAIEIIQDSCGYDEERVSTLMKIFQQAVFFQKSTLVANGVERPSPDEVFCEGTQDRVDVLIPASNAIGIVLRHGLKKEPSLDELEELLKPKV